MPWDALGCSGMLWDALQFFEIDLRSLAVGWRSLWDALGFFLSFPFMKEKG